MMSRQVIGIVFTVAVVLAVVAMLVIAANPFRTIPTVKVVDASWSLTVAGYTLNLAVETTDRVQLVSVEVGGNYYDVVYDVRPPITNLSIPLPVSAPQEQVTLHFDVLNPVKVYAKVGKEPFRVEVVAGRSKLLLYGTVPAKSVVIVTQVPENMNTAVLVNWRRYLTYLNTFKEVVPDANLTVISVPSEEALKAMYAFDTLVFVEVAPEPTLLNDLIRRGKNIVLHTYDYALGEYRVKVVNNTLVEVRVESDNPEIDYMDVPCAMKRFTIDTTTTIDFLNKLKSWLGQVDGSYAVSEFTTQRLFSEVYVKDRFGYVYLGRTRKGFYYSSIGIKHLAVLLASGFFETKGKVSYTSFELQPFSGVRVLDAPVTSSRILIYAEGFGVVQRAVLPPPVAIGEKGDRISITIGIDRYGKTVWSGAVNVRVVEVAYNGRIIDFKVDAHVTLPTMLDLPAPVHTAYLIYVDSKLVYAVADEVTERPYVTISNSEVCEMFYLDVSRRDRYNTPLYLYINGRMVSVLYPGQSYNTTTCVPGYYSVEVRNVYGDVVASKTFRVVRIYEQPLFILSSLLMVSVVVMGYVYTRRRAEKEVDYVTLVLYRLPEKKDVEISVDSVAETIYRIYVRRKMLPTVKEVTDYTYRRRPVMKVVAELFSVLKVALEKGKMIMYSRYMPELDDTITVVGHGKLSTVVSNFYTHIVLEVMKKFGGSPVPKEYLKDVIDVDGALLLGENLLLLTYVTGARRSVDEEIRNAIDRAFTAFMLIRRLKLPFRPIGFAVVTEPKYVKLINRYIDEILGGNRDVAAKLLKDMAVFQRITEASREAWIGRYILAAAPLTRLAPLMAFAKVGAPKLCNHYYRFAPLY
ncbi:MAG: hypothetical protein QXU26_01945 [Thermofilaceae archaeon]